MVLNRKPTMSSARTPSWTFAARSMRCLLQGLPSHHTDEMPTWGLFMSSGSMPVAYSMAYDSWESAGSVAGRQVKDGVVDANERSATLQVFAGSRVPARGTTVI